MEDHNKATVNESTLSSAPATAPKKKEDGFFREIIKFAILALVIVIPVRAFIAQPFVVSGASMDPTFATGEYLVVDELSYRFEQPKRDQVIIFKFPRDPRIYFIKRIIGLPGETVKINQGVVSISSSENPKGITLNEPYISQSNRTYDNFSVTLGDNEYFVMGDNRAQSSDSRYWGPLDRDLIVGRPIVRLFPVSRAAFWPGLEIPQTASATPATK